jgi:hypothetical protein
VTSYPTFLVPQPSVVAQPPLEHIYQQIAEVVADLRRSGRSTRSAGVKTRLNQRLSVPFDEKAYGFPSFREFLTSAEQAGAIQLWPAATGPDVTLGLPGEPVEDSPGRRAPVQIRPDFWLTFMDWTPGFERAFDREQGRAFRVAVAAEAYDPQVRQLRQAMNSGGTRYVRIDPIGLSTQLEWAKTFAVGRPSGERDDLIRDLDGDRPLQKFTRRVRTMPCYPAWVVFRNQRVAGMIQAWAQEHQLTVDPLIPAGRTQADAEPMESAGVSRLSPGPVPGSGPSPGSIEKITPPRARQPSSPPQPASAGLDLASLRRQAHELIEHMTAEELLTLPLSLGMLYRR